MEVENLSQRIKRNCLEITRVPLSEDCTSNEIVMAVGRAIRRRPGQG